MNMSLEQAKIKEQYEQKDSLNAQQLEMLREQYKQHVMNMAVDNAALKAQLASRITPQQREALERALKITSQKMQQFEAEAQQWEEMYDIVMRDTPRVVPGQVVGVGQPVGGPAPAVGVPQ